MTWLQRYRVRHYLANSLWVLPLLSMVAALAVARLLRWVGESAGWQSSVDPDTARTVLTTMASSLFTFIVFVSSALLVAVQLASSQLTPRIIGFMFGNRVTKGALTGFVFAFTFSLAALVQVRTSVPLLTAHLAAYSGLVSLAAFLYLMDHVGKLLRPSGALRGIASLGRRVIETVYPRPLGDSTEVRPLPLAVPEGEPTGVVTNQQDGAVLAFDMAGLVALAERADCVIEMVPQVGDFVAVGDPLFRVFHGKGEVLAGALRQSVAVGQERTLEQDPAFAFRIIVDIAAKGLSPAINDRPPPSWPWTRSTTCCAASAAAAWTTGASVTRPAGCGSSTARRAGKILWDWRSPKSASSAPRVSRWSAACAPCWRT